MSSNLSDQPPFQRLTPQVTDNTKLREPQREAYAAIGEHFSDPTRHREVGVVLQARKVLVIAPVLRIAAQLLADFNPTAPHMSYRKCAVLPGPEYQEPAEIRGTSTNRSDLDAADIVITNIQQLRRGGADNKWLADLPADPCGPRRPQQRMRD